MGKFDNKDTSIYHDISFFVAEIPTTDSTRDGLVRAQSWPVVRAQPATLGPCSSRVTKSYPKDIIFIVMIYDMVLYAVWLSPVKIH